MARHREPMLAVHDLAKLRQALADLKASVLADRAVNDAWRAARAYGRVASLIDIHEQILSKLPRTGNPTEDGAALERERVRLQERALLDAGIPIPSTPEDSEPAPQTDVAAWMDENRSEAQKYEADLAAGRIPDPWQAHRLALEACAPVADTLHDDLRYLEAYSAARLPDR
jgi:hypothetical protein